MTEIRHWMTTNFKGDYVPAFVEQRDGSPNLVVHAHDFTGMTKAEAEATARARNVEQVSKAEADVERLRLALVAAEDHLARVRAILKPTN